MRLADEVRDQIQSFMDGNIDSQQLTGWLDSVSDEIDADHDQRLRELAGATYTIVAEFGYGHRTWIELCGALGRALDESIERTHGTPQTRASWTGVSVFVSPPAITLGRSPSRVGTPHAAALW
jgi:hypothetical protein